MKTYIRVRAGVYLYRAVDSAGASIDFLLSAQRDAAAAKRFFQALRFPNHPTPRVINVDKNPSHPPVVEALKAEGTLRRRCRLRPVQYLNNILDQDHRAITRRVKASQGFRSGEPAVRSKVTKRCCDSEGASQMAGRRSNCPPTQVHRRAVPDFSLMRRRHRCLFCAAA